MSARRSWIATTHTTVDVTDASQLVLPANEAARFRLLVPLFNGVCWVGLDQAAVVKEGAPISIAKPWSETAADTASVMFRGDIHLIHNVGEGFVIPVVVIEGEEAPVIP